MILLPLINLRGKAVLIFYFAWKNIKIKSQETYLGFLWAGLTPTLYFIFFYFLISSFWLRPREDFSIYLLSGIIIFHLFWQGTFRGSGSFGDNRALINSTKINGEFFPVTSTLTIGIFSIFETGIFFLIGTLLGWVPSWSMVLLPLVLFLLLGLILGISYLLLVLSYFKKSIRSMWTALFFVWFFISPIFWYLDEAEGLTLVIHKINPLGQIIELFHKIVLNQIPTTNDWAYATLLVLFTIVFGFSLFSKYQKKAMEAYYLN